MIDQFITLASLVLAVLITIEYVQHLRRRRSGNTVTLTFRVDEKAIQDAILRELEWQWKGKV